MWIVAGLGNPGSRYERTRHNVGFDTVDTIAELLRGTWRERGSKGASSLVAKVRGAWGEAVLCKPMEFMNRSGGPLLGVLQSEGGDVAKVIVVHDDIDIPFGSVKVKTGGGSGGHNGLKSVTASLGSPDYVRVRVGVGRPPPEWVSAGGEDSDPVARFVLSGWTEEERRVIPKVKGRAAEVVEALIGRGVNEAQRVASLPLE